MERSTLGAAVASLLCVALVAVVSASDPELLTDYANPPNGAAPTADYFTSTVLRNVAITPGVVATVTPVNVGVLPSLQGLGTSLALLQFSPGSLNPPHLHPRGTEILYVLEGELNVGLLDSSNRLFTKTLQQGDVFVFPRGLVHFQINNGFRIAKAVSGFSSANPGTIRIAVNLFGSNGPVSKTVLAKAFNVHESVIQTLLDAQS